MELAEELQARILIHKIGMTGGVLMQEYASSQLSGDVKLPKFQVLEMADEYSNKIIQKAIKDGTFDSLYEKAWERVKHRLPQGTNLMA